MFDVELPVILNMARLGMVGIPYNSARDFSGEFNFANVRLWAISWERRSNEARRLIGEKSTRRQIYANYAIRSIFTRKPNACARRRRYG